MSPSIAGLVVFALVFGSALLGFRIHVAYPKHSVGSETEATVTVTIKLIALMTALMLGLLVSSAKDKYDAQKGEITAMSAKIVLLDRLLWAYGPEATEPRARLHHVVEQMIARIWPRDRHAQLDPSASSGTKVFEAILALSPKNESQRLIKEHALLMALDSGEMRWLVYAQTDYAIPLPMLAILVACLSVIFFSYGLFATFDVTVTVVLVLAALSVSGALFVIMELDQPFDGFIRIASTPLDMALAHLSH